MYSLEPYYNFLPLLLRYTSFTIFSYQFFGSAHYIIRYRDIVPNARERIMIFSFRYYSFLPKFEFLKFCSKNGGSVKEILMIPTPIVIFLFCFALLICLTLFVSISQILFQICRHFFRARFLSPCAQILLERSIAFHSDRDSFSRNFFRMF